MPTVLLGSVGSARATHYGVIMCTRYVVWSVLAFNAGDWFDAYAYDRRLDGCDSIGDQRHLCHWSCCGE